MTIMTASDSKLLDKAETACQRIAPLWPAKNFVAVNPYHGLANQSFWQAHETLERITGTGLCMPRAYYREQVAQGRITRKDLAAALQELGSSWDVSAFEQELARDNPLPAAPFPLLTGVLAELNGQDWPNFVVERISRYCAAYFDEGQALWSMPWRGTSLYTGWTAFTRLDKSPRVMGVRGMRKAMTQGPESAQDAIVWALRELDIPAEAVDDYLHAALLSVGGWAGWTRYLRWQAELQGGHDDSIRDLLAIRLAWDALLYKLSYTETLETEWRQSLASAATPVGRRKYRVPVGAVLQTAFEDSYQRQLAASLTGAGAAKLPSARAEVQAVFCIDVRSEVYRRALETVAPPVQTLGTAGFFGVLMEYLPFGAAETQGHLPIFFKPSYRISEGLNHASAREVGKLTQRRQTRVHAAKAWKVFKTSASSGFGFVEAAGLLSAPKLISDSMGWTRPVPSPERLGLSLGEHNRLSPLLTPGESGAKTSANGGLGIPETDRPALAEFVLRNMGMVRDFAKLVLIVGHGSTTVNNPQATGLDCGACAGQSGEASARIAAALLNDPPTRRGLAEKGIDIPDDTYFLAALHDTATDEVQLFGADAVPVRHSGGVAQLRQWLEAAGDVARMERSRFLGLGGSPGPFVVHTKMQQRSRDWAQLRPEWALAGNAAFIAAPRQRTAGRDLAGRAFLHEYDWHHDTGFNTLQLIMTGPMIVAHWINMQYYGSVVDNRRLGSGNKVLHNVVGGSIGVLEGNGGDLRPGLALQSLHDGVRWMHEPMRLMVIIEAPQHAIDDVILGHNAVRELAGNSWIHLFQLGDDGRMNRRRADGKWRPY